MCLCIIHIRRYYKEWRKYKAPPHIHREGAELQTFSINHLYLLSLLGGSRGGFIMKIEIITIGDQPPIGQVVDTNSAWMAKELNKIGFDVYRITLLAMSVRSRSKHLNSFKPGGCGVGDRRNSVRPMTTLPRKRYANFSIQNWYLMKAFWGILKLCLLIATLPSTSSLTEAYVPRDATAIQNTGGTAPITWFERVKVLSPCRGCTLRNENGNESRDYPPNGG